ncbi:MAG: hypothetical protein ACYDD4_08765 [Acidimicrobiales bacterium]
MPVQLKMVPTVQSDAGDAPGRVDGAETARRDRSRSAGVRAATLLQVALGSDDAEATGLRADEVLAQAQAAEQVLGAPDAWDTAVLAVAQRYGRVGALLVVGFQQRWARRHGMAIEMPDTVEAALDLLIERFATVDAEELASIMSVVDRAEGVAVDHEATAARRWLHATYAVAERDGSPNAHRQYMLALERVMRGARTLLAS